MYIEQFLKNDVFLIFLPQFCDPDLVGSSGNSVTISQESKT